MKSQIAEARFQRVTRQDEVLAGQSRKPDIPLRSQRIAERQRSAGRLLLLGRVLTLGHWPAFVDIPRKPIPVGDALPPGRRLTILHLSDLHLEHGKPVEPWLTRQLSTVRPDLICVTGDLVDRDDAIEPCADLLAALPSRLGTFVVLGNHDYSEHYPGRVKGLWHRLFPLPLVDSGRLVGALERRGLVVLRNEARRLETAGCELWIVGLDDPYSQRHDPAAAFTGVPDRPARRRFRLVLAHTPDVCQELRPGQVDLLLAGHTHGGQVCLPWFGALKSNSAVCRGRQAAGLIQRFGVRLHVSRGLGMVSLPLRFCCSPEAAVLELEGTRL